MQIFSFNVSLHNAGFAGCDSLLCPYLFVISFSLVRHISLLVSQVINVFAMPTGIFFLVSYSLLVVFVDDNSIIFKLNFFDYTDSTQKILEVTKRCPDI